MGSDHIQRSDAEADGASAEALCRELAEVEPAPEVIGVLAEALLRQEPRVRGAAAAAIGKLLGYREEVARNLRFSALKALRDQLDNERDAAVVSTILSSIGLIGDAGDISRVSEFLDWPDRRVRGQAEWAARRLSADNSDPQILQQRLLGTWSGNLGGRITFLADKSFQAEGRFDEFGEQVVILQGWWFQPDLSSVTLEVDVPEIEHDFVYVELAVVGRDANACLVSRSHNREEWYRPGAADHQISRPSPGAPL